MIQIQFQILRRESSESKPYWQEFSFETENQNMTVATALTELNQTLENPVRWECSCLQKKCGACAMRINQKPRLACDAVLTEFSKSGKIILEPLKKFPVIADLIIDRSILFENLKTLKLWFEEDAKTHGSEIAYEASRCLQCGCCLEICPNFSTESKFFGMSAAVPVSRLFTNLPDVQKKELFQAYRKQIYEGCGKSLACRNVCPAGIEIEKLLVNSNAVAIWKRKPKKYEK